MNERRTIASVKNKIAAFFREEERMPTYEEIMVILEVKSTSVAFYWVNRLVEANILERKANGRLAWKEKPFSIPLLGEVAAGLPSPEEEELRDVISLDEYLVTKPEVSFILQVSGDSMIGEGILSGDLVIVEKGRAPRNGDIVIAEVDGEWTMKYFRKKGSEIYLEAANPKYSPIWPVQELKIGGIVTAVIRKYRTK
jgi:SOS regulatory protein LexA